MSDEKPPRFQHAQYDAESLSREEPEFPHVTDSRDCWCEPDVMKVCDQCDAQPGETPEPNREAYLPPCPFCGGSGIAPADGTEDEDETLIVIHHDR